MLPWTISELLVTGGGEPSLHKFNALHPALGIQDECAGSVSLINKTSNGFAHAVDKYHLDETFSNSNSPFGNILLNGTGSYNVNMGKNAAIFAKERDFKFGVTSKITTDWIPPSKSLNPLDIILGESPVGLSLKKVCEPTVSKAEIKYYNQYNQKYFGEYESVFNGMKRYWYL